MITARNLLRPGKIPLSFAQERVWLLGQIEGASGRQNLSTIRRLTGKLDEEALDIALKDTLERHQVLRMVVEDDDGPWERLLPMDEVGAWYDKVVADEKSAQTLGTAKAGDCLLVTEVTKYDFDLGKEIPFRVRLIQAGPDTHLLVLAWHQIAGDAGSGEILVRDLAANYSHRVKGKQPPGYESALQYPDFTVWQNETLGDEEEAGSLMAKQVGYWRKTLAGAPERMELPSDWAYPKEADQRSGVVRLEVGEPLLLGLEELAERLGVSLLVVFQAGMAALLNRLGGGTDIVVGCPTSGRLDPSLDSLVGCFSNMLVLRTDTAGNPSFLELLGQVDRMVRGAYEHQVIPFEHLVSVLDPPRSLANHPLFQVVLDLQAPKAKPVEMPGLQVEVVDPGLRSTAFDLRFNLREQGKDSQSKAGIEGELIYRADLFEAETAERLVGQWLRLLEAVANHPEGRLSEIDLLGEAEREQLLVAWNGNDILVPEMSLAELFEAQVSAVPEAVAVVYEDGELSYGELNARANRLAHLLLSLGVGREEAVSMLLPRGLDVVVAILAIVKAGAVYAPLDFRHPPTLMDRMLTEAGVRFLLVSSDEVMVPGFSGEIMRVTDPRVEEQPSSNPGKAVAPDQLAYVMYTSGSTGVPKGIAITQRDVVAMTMDAHFGPAHNRLLFHHPHAFDASTYELWVPLLHGGTIVIAPGDNVPDAEGIEYAVREQGVSVVFLPTAVLALIADETPLSYKGISELWTGGEALHGPTAQQIIDNVPEVTFVNAYGPTETTTYATCLTVSRKEDCTPFVAIGKPMDGVRVYVLGSYLELMPVGVPGELYIGGLGLARGYLARPDLTSERFIACPFGVGERMYRTGDLVRWNREGNLEFIGRADHQVKLQGWRIEYAEVEAALRGHPGVMEAVATVREDRPGDRRLVGYVITDGSEIDLGEVRRTAATRLAEYMVPNQVVTIDKLPLTPSGKLDRGRLPEPSQRPIEREPKGEAEVVLCGLFAEVLKLPQVGVEQSFFELGGHSLLVTRLASRMRQVMGVELAFRTIFEAPTVEALALKIGDTGRMRAALQPEVRPLRPPLSYAQKRLWFLEILGDTGSSYNVPVAWRLRGKLDEDALRAAFGDVIERHELLRTLIMENEGEAWQKVLANKDVNMHFTVMEADEAGLEAAMDQVILPQFKLGEQIPLRAGLVRLGNEEQVLVVAFHHIAADGWSLQPFANDLGKAYRARRAGETAGWEKLPVQYVDYSLWQERTLGDGNDPTSLMAEQIGYWKRTLADIPERIELPTDRPYPAVAQNSGATVPFRVGAQTHQGMVSLAKREKATPYMVLEAAMAGLLTRLGAGTDILLGSPIAGRLDAALDDLVGFFVNTVVLRADTSGDPTFLELLGRVRERAFEAYAHQDVPFERLVEALAPERTLAHNLIFQVMVAYQSQGSPVLEMAGLEVTAMEAEVAEVPFDLDFQIYEQRDDLGEAAGLTGCLEYRSDIFDPETAKEICERLERFLDGVVLDPSIRLSRVDLLSAEERRQLTGDWDDPQGEPG